MAGPISWLRNRFRAEGRPSDAADYWYQPQGYLGGLAAAGVRVTPERAMQLSAVYACVQIISKTIASLPLIVYKERADGGKDRAPNHPLYEILHERPNSWQTSFEFIQMMQAQLLLRGNAYAQIVPGPRGAVDQLLPIHPDRVRVYRLSDPDGVLINRIQYEVSMPNSGKPMILTQEEMFHLRGLSSDGLVGRSVIQDYAFQTLGAAIAMQEYGSRFYANDASPSGVLTTPNKLEDKVRTSVVKSWHEAHSGANAHKTALLEQDLKFQPISITNRDAQLLESRRFTVSDIARIFGVPPHKIGDLDRATFSNIEQQNIEFATDTIRPWCVCWEQRIAHDLIVEDEQDDYDAEFVMQGLLRGDTLSRFEAYQIALQNKIMVPNEVRALENLNPIDGGDQPLQTPNNTAPGDTTQMSDPAVPKKPKKAKKPKMPAPMPADSSTDFAIDGAGA